jgi:hypothetical protein
MSSSRDERPAEHPRNGLDDPRALDILTTEHWSLLSTRTLGYQEMFGRTTIFVGILSGTIVALALLAQATNFGRATLWCVLALTPVTLFIGVVTFIRSVAINFEDARWVAGMDLLRRAYVRMVPDVERYLLSLRDAGVDRGALAHGAPQRIGNVAWSLTTTSSVVATLDSVLAGAIAADVSALLRAPPVATASIGAVIAILSGLAHVQYAARFRRRHTPPA